MLFYRFPVVQVAFAKGRHQDTNSRAEFSEGVLDSRKVLALQLVYFLPEDALPQVYCINPGFVPEL
jgi:hypothetical protein